MAFYKDYLMLRVGIFNCPEVKENDKVEVIYDCNSVNSPLYNCRVICKVHYIKDNKNILVELPPNYKKVGAINGWKGESIVNSISLNLKPKRLYWWIKTWRLITNRKNLELE